VVNLAGLELDLDYLPAGVVDVGTDHETFTTAISTVVDGNDVAGDDFFGHDDCCKSVSVFSGWKGGRRR